MASESATASSTSSSSATSSSSSSSSYSVSDSSSVSMTKTKFYSLSSSITSTVTNTPTYSAVQIYTMPSGQNTSTNGLLIGSITAFSLSGLFLLLFVIYRIYHKKQQQINNTTKLTEVTEIVDNSKNVIISNEYIVIDDKAYFLDISNGKPLAEGWRYCSDNIDIWYVDKHGETQWSPVYLDDSEHVVNLYRVT